MIVVLVVCPIMLLGCALILWILWDGVVCGAYDPSDYRCGKCQRCRREMTAISGETFASSVEAEKEGFEPSKKEHGSTIRDADNIGGRA